MSDLYSSPTSSVYFTNHPIKDRFTTISYQYKTVLSRCLHRFIDTCKSQSRPGNGGGGWPW